MNKHDFKLDCPVTIGEGTDAQIIDTVVLHEPVTDHLRHIARLKSEWAKVIGFIEEARSERQRTQGDAVPATEEPETEEPELTFSMIIQAVPGVDMAVVYEVTLAVLKSGGCTLPDIGPLTQKRWQRFPATAGEQIILEYVDSYLKPSWFGLESEGEGQDANEDTLEGRADREAAA